VTGRSRSRTARADPAPPGGWVTFETEANRLMATRAQKLVIIEKVTGRIPNRYEAVRVMAKEARRLNALVIRGAEAEEDFKPTTSAVDRLINGQIDYQYVEAHEGPKSLFDDDE